MKKILAVSLCAMFCAAGVVSADFSQDNWQYKKEINVVGSPKSGELVEVTLDYDVFNNSKDDLSDLRITNNDIGEVPYKVIIEKSSFSSANVYPVKLLNNSFVSGKYNLFIVDFGQAGFLNSSLKVSTYSENFRRQVQIEGSNDMQNWSILKTDGYIYDYTDRAGNFKAQNTTINYPENAYRYLQVKIFTGGEAAISVMGAQVSKITKSATKETSLVPDYKISQNQEKKITEIEIDLAKKGWPTSSIEISSPSENFNREVVIYESADKESWKRLGQSYIFSYDTPKFKGASLNINYTESSEQFLKIEIYNKDNQPISVDGLSVKAILRNIVFQYVPNSNYQLYYGNEDARFAQYDLDKFFGYLDTGKRNSASLAVEEDNPNFVAKESPKLPLTERIPNLLNYVLVFAVLVLGFFVFRLFKKVK